MDNNCSGLVVRKTRSLCPVCLLNIPADLVEYSDKKVYMEKSCPWHGKFKTLIWRGQIDFNGWREDVAPMLHTQGLSCPDNCGICSEHVSGTCCVLLDVTKNCNLGCRFCFADGKNNQLSEDPPLEKLKQDVDFIFSKGDATIQLSGGEPTLRDDLPQLVKYIKEKGGKYVQLNSNGIRLAEDEAYVRALADAGLSYVFLQFDGISDDVFEKLRGRKLLDIKKKAINMCGRYGVGTTLVPTIVRGVNDDQIGKIVHFGMEMSPYVRGVHFQPVSFFGRIPNIPSEDERYTLDELMRSLIDETGVCACSVNPSCCDHPGCGFHASYVIEDGKLVPTGAQSDCCCGGEASAKQNREYIGARWSALQLETEENAAPGSFDEFLNEYAKKGFTITAMAFQDAGNIDIERLRRCSLHTLKDNMIVPFCVKYLTRWED